MLYTQSSEKNEFWYALLEKAFAKFYGCYECLEDGWISDVLEDFTGGISETFVPDTRPSNLFEILLKAFDQNACIACVNWVKQNYFRV